MPKVDHTAEFKIPDLDELKRGHDEEACRNGFSGVIDVDTWKTQV